MKKLQLLITSLFTLLIVSCANMNTVKNAPPESGVHQIFTADYELVKSAVLASMQNLNINIKETSDTDKGFVITFTKSISAFSWGEVGRVLIVKGDNNKSTVFVHSEKRSKYQLTGADEKDFAYNIFSDVKEIISKENS